MHDWDAQVQAMMAPIAKDVVLMVARMMWNDCVDGAWVVVQNKSTQSKRKQLGTMQRK